MISIFLFLMPVLLNVRFDFVGSVAVGELVLVAATPWALPRMMGWIKVRRVKFVLLLIALFFLAQIISDLYRGSDPYDYMRGWARLVVTSFSFVVLGALIQGDENRIRIFIAGFALSSFLVYGGAVDVSLLTMAERFKYGIGSAIVMFVFMGLGVARVRSRLWLAIPFLLGLCAFFLNARSLAGITLATTVLAFVVSQPNYSKSLVNIRTIRFCAGGLVAAIGLLYAYEFSASAGYFGDTAKEKYLQQSDRTGSFSILSGRDEMYYTLPKIIDSPIVGWGSWHRDLPYVLQRTMEMGHSENASKYIAESRMGLVPAHSHIFGGWMEAGIMGGVFWVYVLFLLFRVIMSGAFNQVEGIECLVLYVLVNFTWDIFFSPYAGERRMWTGFLLALIVIVLDKHERRVASRNSPLGVRPSGKEGVALI